MKRVSVFLIAFLIVSLFLPLYQIPKVKASPDIEELFVNALDDTFLEWAGIGDSPYLNDLDANYISEGADGTDKEGYFDFANSGVGVGVINSVIVALETKYVWAGYPKSFKLFVWDGVQWVDFGVVTPDGDTFGWKDVDVSASIDSWAKIDGCRVYVEEVSAGPTYPYVHIRRCKLKIDYGAAVGEYSEEFSETIDVSASLNVWKALFQKYSETITVSATAYSWREKASFHTETTTITEQLNQWIELRRFFTETITITETASFAMEILIEITEFTETITVDASLFLWKAKQFITQETISPIANFYDWIELKMTMIEFSELIELAETMYLTLPVPPIEYATKGFVLATIMLLLLIGLPILGLIIWRKKG